MGVVCMDMMMVDVTDVSGAGVGDEITLLGADRQGGPARSRPTTWRPGPAPSTTRFCPASRSGFPASTRSNDERGAIDTDSSAACLR